MLMIIPRCSMTICPPQVQFPAYMRHIQSNSKIQCINCSPPEASLPSQYLLLTAIFKFCRDFKTCLKKKNSRNDIASQNMTLPSKQPQIYCVLFFAPLDDLGAFLWRV